MLSQIYRNRLNSINTLKRNGTITYEDFNIERNRILVGLLDTIHVVKKNHKSIFKYDNISDRINIIKPRNWIYRSLCKLFPILASSKEVENVLKPDIFNAIEFIDLKKFDIVAESRVILKIRDFHYFRNKLPLSKFLFKYAVKS